MTQPSPIASARDAAQWAIAEGFRPIPIPSGGKRPTIKGWQHLEIAASQLNSCFPLGSGIGLLLGVEGSNLVDIDLDCAEARRVAAMFLPPTGRIHGRASALRSHYWYRVATPPRREAFADPTELDADRATLIELRGAGGQTNIPPTVHPSGESLNWETEGDIPLVDTGMPRE